MVRGKRIITLLLAVLVTLSCVPSIAFAADTEFTIYNSSFEDEKITFDKKSGKTEYVTDEKRSGERAVKISGYTSESNVPRMTLSEINREASTNVSVWVKPVSADKAVTFTMYLYAKNGVETEKIYKLATKTAGSDFVNITGKMFTKYISMLSSVQIAITAETEDGYTDYIMDDLTVTSNMASAAEANPVEVLKPTGKYTIRASFEKDTLEFFNTAGAAEFLITDEVTAHTGQNSLKVTNRMMSDGTMMIYFPNAAPDAKINISCWVRNEPGAKSRGYTLQAIIPTGTGKKWPAISGTITASDSGWTQMTGTIDCTQYKVTGTVGVQIVAGVKYGSFFDYYVDDVLVTTDTDGDLYDDLDYVETEKPDYLSDTPNQASPKYIDIQDDIPAMKDVFKDYFKIGATIQNRSESDTSRYGRLVKKHFNSLVSDGMYKMTEILTDAKDLNKYTFTYADTLMDFAQRNGMDLVGHCLLWEKPSSKKYIANDDGSFRDKDTILKFMKEYITHVMQHFEGDGPAEEYVQGVDYTNWHAESWDVVNEAVQGVDEDGNIIYTNNGAWYAALGAEYIDYAYQFADETGYKDVKLRYNDFSENVDNKRGAMIKLLKGLRDKGLRVDIMGMQSHFHSATTAASVRKAIQDFLGIGIDVDVTEIDLNAYTYKQTTEKKKLYEDGVPKEVEFRQATLYAELFKLYREYAEHIERVNFWSFQDDFAYANRETSFPRTEYCGIFDRNYQAKPQYWAIIDPTKYYNEILKEDTAVTRLVINSVQTDLKDNRTSIIDENGVKYMKVDELLDDLGIKYVKLGGKLNFIKNGLFYEVSSDGKMKRAFEDYKLKNAVISKDESLYVPIEETAVLIGYSVDNNTDRNMISISVQE